MYRFKLAISLLICLVPINSARSEDSVKVYVLAGQSNMEGKSKNKLWDHQASDETTSDFFAHLRAGDGWVERDDVLIKFLNRSGPLTLGYGSPGCTGSEYEFGYVMGEYHASPVLLIKTAWGGHSLYKLFRSPSNPVPRELLEEDLTKSQDRIRKNNERRNRNDPLPTLDEIRSEYGKSYRKMMAEVKATQDNIDTLFPTLKGKKLEMAGFFWFQGWNDQYGAEAEYASNLRHFINDVRNDLESPKLPFVIAVMGQNQSQQAKGAMKVIQDAQLSLETEPEFNGNVKAVRTDVLVDKAAESLYPTWKENFERWEQTGSDRAYHYLGSAIWYTRIGRECAKAMIKLEENVSR
ncbi:MAG: hypothetical protein KDB00_23455 [Planctomycetales bacterium]|nr:hypothetical protein [Planctomycetales bacterium]